MWENDKDCAQIAELFFHYIPRGDEFTVLKGKKLGSIDSGWGPEFHLSFDYEQTGINEGSAQVLGFNHWDSTSKKNLKVPHILAPALQNNLNIQFEIGGKTVSTQTGELKGRTHISLDQSYDRDGKLIYT